jgi:hypothetical protein
MVQNSGNLFPTEYEGLCATLYILFKTARSLVLGNSLAYVGWDKAPEFYTTRHQDFVQLLE